MYWLKSTKLFILKNHCSIIVDKEVRKNVDFNEKKDSNTESLVWTDSKIIWNLWRVNINEREFEEINFGFERVDEGSSFTKVTQKIRYLSLRVNF